MATECTCPNCRRIFNPASLLSGEEYCPKCWNAWCKNDGSFERRTKPLSDVIKEQLAEEDTENQLKPDPAMMQQAMKAASSATEAVARLQAATGNALEKDATHSEAYRALRKFSEAMDRARSIAIHAMLDADERLSPAARKEESK